MELHIGPFDTAVHVRTRDHFQAMRREAALLGLGAGTPPRRWEELVARLYEQLGLGPVTDAVDRAYLAGERTFSSCLDVPDQSARAAAATCVELLRLLDEVEAWAGRVESDLLALPPEVDAYQRAFLAQLAAQLPAPAG